MGVKPKRTLLTRIVCVLLHPVALSPVLLAQPDRTMPQDTASDQTAMVILTHQGPVLANLRISVAKTPYRTWVGRFLAIQMDSDKDGVLSASELNLLTDNLRRLANISGDVAVAMDADGRFPEPSTSPQHVSPEEFAAWLQNRLPRAFDLIAQPRPADDAVRLAELIDADDDGLVSRAEVNATFQTLRFRDLDDDQTLSIAELIPYRDPRSQQAALTPDAASLPFFHITDPDSARMAATRIVRRYGKNETIPGKLLRLPPDSPADASGGSEVSAPDLADWLLQPVFHFVVDVKLSDRSNTSDIDVTVTPDSAAWCIVHDDTFGQCSLRIDGIPIRILARGGGSRTRKVTRGFLGQTFVMIDADRSQSLDASEFSGIAEALRQSGASGSFAEVDIDQNLQITREELFSFAERDQMAAASRIEVSVGQDGKSLFSEIDTNKDRRLSVREIQSATESLVAFDLDGDGSVADTELGTEYSLTFGLGQPEIRRVSPMPPMNMMGMNSNAVLPGRDGLSGPEWFRRMDRNQDGDISRREFLGRAEQFVQLDTDADQLISADEAASARPAP